MENKIKVNIYTDGACSGNPGPGGYGTILVHKDANGITHEKELSEGFKCVTNNQMELMANVDLWKRLLSAKEKHEVEFVWVKGHAGHEFNERCDTLAVQAYKQENLKEL